MAVYQPKVNPQMVMLGYLGANPTAAGLAGGYGIRQTPPNVKKEEPAKKNPYMK